ncbi:MAG: tripartite tricarboxylate transporter substrate binding protein, partial [Betaproteobacteria bacterium]|nr:tripartite tricarboxylate transporter substrate binding protein [Betaproteobacteria bacterium]
MDRVAQKLLVSLAMAAAVVAAAAADFPTKPVRLVVPFPPGGTLDASARLIAAKLRENWTQPIIVENRGGGANGAVGVDHVVKSAPDGHTLVLIAMIVLTTPQMQRTPYDVMRDLVGVVQTAEIGYALAAAPKTGLSTIGELIEIAKKDPNRLNYGSAGNGSGMHLYTELV